MTTSDEFSVRFWGVRGSIACCSADYARYGGNTSCIEIRCGDRVLIFDAGTGIRPLGKQLVQSLPVSADLFFTHTHLDHIVGLPFFAPLYKPGSKIRIWSGHLEAPLTFKDALTHLMAPPLFCVRSVSLRSRRTLAHAADGSSTARPCTIVHERFPKIPQPVLSHYPAS